MITDLSLHQSVTSPFSNISILHLLELQIDEQFCKREKEKEKMADFRERKTEVAFQMYLKERKLYLFLSYRTFFYSRIKQRKENGRFGDD